MPVELIPFTGIMDLDSPDSVIPMAHHQEARNIVFRGTQPSLRLENLPGTTLIPFSTLPPSGTNKTKGKFYDPIGKRIFFFNYNSNFTSGIYVYNTIQGTFETLVQVGFNTTLDPLGFTPDVISNIDIIYGDSTQGDILYWIDDLGRPSKINVKRALDGDYGSIQRSFLDVAKEPADIPPYVVYENDNTVTVNNLRKRLFKFKVRWVFDDNDKSVTSSQSEVPLPFAPFNTSVDSNPTINSRIAIVYQTGAANVKKIELLAAVNIGSLFSDYFLIASIDKEQDGIADNDVATFLFYNDKAYNYINVEESIQLYDYVPISAGAQAILNGDTITYGNCLEGYPNLLDFANNSDQTSNITVATAPYYYGNFYTLFSAFQDGKSAFSFGSIHVVLRGGVLTPPFTNSTFYVYFTDGTNINYTVLSGDDPASVIEGLRVDAIGKGFTIISAGDNDLYISKANIELARAYLDSDFGANASLNGSQFAYDWWSKHGWGLVYFDQKGRTNGAVYTDGFSVNSLPYSETLAAAGDIPQFTASIYHRPPAWAYYYQWVRTKDLTKSKILQWISDRTLKDTNTGIGQDAFAYISIENLNTFIQKNPGTPLGYSYSPNDRIRFIKLFNGDGSTAQLYTQKDFEIISSITNPAINGIDYTGQFIKIKLPSTDGTFDFGSSTFANYFIELYTPAQSVANGLDVYYEFGERYAIGNETTGLAIHQGMNQNQSTDLLTPATFTWTKGDFYERLRSIQTGQEIVYEVTAGSGSDVNAGRITVGLTPVSVSYSDPNITPGSSPLQNLIGFNLATNTTRQILTIVNGTYTFRIRGTIVINFPDNRSGDSYEFYLQKNDGTLYQLVEPFDCSVAATHSFNVDTTFTMTTGQRIFIFGYSIPGYDHTRSFTKTNLTITRESAFSQRCIDPNFSDYYASAVNSNGRAFVYDPNANQVTFPTMYRWGLAYQEDTNINQVNRFYPQNFDVIERSWGAIKKMRVWDRVLTFFQERKCGQTGIYAKFIRDNAGTNQLVTTSDIITSNNVQYYDGNFGVYNQPDSIVQSRYVYYFVDPILGKILRLSKDGITDLTELYKVQTWGGQNITDYLKDYSYQFGGNACITGTFNVRSDNVGEYILTAQRGVNGSETIGGESLAFDETKNCFTSFYDFAPDCIVCAENVLYSFRNGKLYKHTSNVYNNFYDVQYESSVKKVYNQNIFQKKTWISLNEVSSAIWDCPEITTSLTSVPGVKQESNLVTADFSELEGQFSASFLKDMHSIGGIVNGDALKGEYIVIKFRLPSERATELATFTLAIIKYIDSPFNIR